MEEILIKRQIVTRKEPVNLVPSDLRFFSHDLSRQLEDVSLISLKNVWVFENGMAFHNFKVVPESLPSKDWAERFPASYLLRKLISRKKRKAPAELNYLLVTDEWSRHYFHWMLDVLPRLYIMKDRLNEFTLLLPESYTQAYVSSFLDIFGVKNIFRLPPAGLMKVQELKIAGHLSASGNYVPEVLKRLRDFILGKLEIVPGMGGAEKIYISRARAAVRKVTNEDEVSSALTALGFKTVYFEEHTVYEQIFMASQAKFIIGLHGAGLTNILFMQGGSLFELRKENDGNNNCYFSLASALDIKYFYQFNTVVENELAGESDVIVDVADLLLNVKQMLDHK